MKITEKGTKKFTKEEILSILKESESLGPELTMEKYGLYPNTFYNWKRKFKDAGVDGLDHGMTSCHVILLAVFISNTYNWFIINYYLTIFSILCVS